MSGQTIVNFDGLSADAARELADGMAKASRARIEAIASVFPNMEKLTLEDVNKAERLFGISRMADGNCGNGCAG
ncbi:MAG: hypothetical protein Q9M24_07590 [Mariprofundaceae bacterium]|nr:hypothetical protein [Mariprofundaceae bacterium]